MKLPEPVAYMDVLGTIFHKVEHELSTDIKLYSEAQVRETFEPVLKQALEALRSTDDHTQITAMIALEEALK